MSKRKNTEVTGKRETPAAAPGNTVAASSKDSAAPAEKALTTDEKLDLVRILVDNVAEDFDEEDILHMMLEKKVSVEVERSLRAAGTLGQRTADRIAKFAGSWGFIFSFTALLLFWMFGNNLLRDHAFDAYPYILLNLVLSCVAAVQAPLIMMSQNRREERDREQAENAYRVNLKSEFILEDLHKKMDRILENQARLLEQSDGQQNAVKKSRHMCYTTNQVQTEEES